LHGAPTRGGLRAQAGDELLDASKHLGLSREKHEVAGAGRSTSRAAGTPLFRFFTHRST
jgi:hypothetical protein